MSHETGEIEVLVVDDRYIHLRYHRAKNPALRGQFMVYKRDDEACWTYDLEPADGFNAPKFPRSSNLDVVDGPE